MKQASDPPKDDLTELLKRAQAGDDQPAAGPAVEDTAQPVPTVEEPETPPAAGHDEATDAPGTALQSLRELTSDRDMQRKNFTLRRMLGGELLSEWARKELGVIVLVVVLLIVYIANRYASQQEMLEIDRLKIQLQDLKYDALTRSSELLERSRRSRIEDYLKASHDSTLQTATVPPYVIKIEEP